VNYKKKKICSLNNDLKNVETYPTAGLPVFYSFMGPGIEFKMPVTSSHCRFT